MICTAGIGKRASAARNLKDDDGVAARHWDGLDSWKYGRLDLAEFIMNIFQRGRRDLLADDLPVGGDAEQNEAAEAVQHRTNGVHSLGALAGGLLEFHLLGFATGYQVVYFLKVH